MDVDDQTNSNHANNIDGDEHQSNHLNSDTANSSINNSTNNTTNSPSIPNRNNNSRKTTRRGSSARAPCGYLVFASESRKRLIRDNPGIPFGEMSRMIGDQWRRLTASERDKYEEKARERAREQEVGCTPSAQVATNITTNYDSHSMPVINTQRMVNGGVTINGHYQNNPNMPNVHQMNGNIQTIAKPPAAAVVTCPPRTQRLVHSEAYLRYIENLKSDSQFISDWPKQLKASMNNTSNGNNGNNLSRAIPSNWFLNGSPGLYNNVNEALWSMRDNMWSDVIRIRNVLSDEW
jgi:protein polybromo-1